MFWLLFCTFLNVPPGFYNQDSQSSEPYLGLGTPTSSVPDGRADFRRLPGYDRIEAIRRAQANRRRMEALSDKPYVPDDVLVALIGKRGQNQRANSTGGEKFTLASLCAGGLKSGVGLLMGESLKRLCSSLPEADSCTTRFLPGSPGLSKCLTCLNISCNLNNPLDGLAPLILCTYTTISSAGSPPAALKALEDVLYSLLDLAKVPQLKEILTKGFKTVEKNISFMDMQQQQIILPASAKVANECLTEDADAAKNMKEPLETYLVSKLSCMVKELTKYEKDMRSSAEKILCDIFSSFTADESSSKPKESVTAVNDLMSWNKCSPQPSRWNGKTATECAK